MTEYYHNIMDYIDNFIEINTDPRTKDKFMVSSPVPTILLSLLYVIMVTKILPAYMKGRPPFQLKNILMIYNLFQVILSAYIVYLSYGSVFQLFGCIDLDQSMNPNAIMAMNAVYVYFLSKFTEFLDTIFFVLRKKFNQVSFLHVYHHGTVPISIYVLARFFPGGIVIMLSGTNSLIHVIMYTYYLLAGFGPRFQKYLWWKKYLTTLQLIQFSYAMVNIVAIWFTRFNCPVGWNRKPLLVYYAVYFASFLFLFYRFYQDAYVKRNQRKFVRTAK